MEDFNLEHTFRHGGYPLVLAAAILFIDTIFMETFPASGLIYLPPTPYQALTKAGGILQGTETPLLTCLTFNMTDSWPCLNLCLIAGSLLLGQSVILYS